MASFIPPSIISKSTKVAFPHRMTIKQFETVNRGDMTSSSNRSCKIEISGIDYLNTQEAVLMYQLHATHATGHYINVDVSAYSVWEELSIISNTGETIDHISNFNLLMNKLIEYRTSPAWTSSAASRYGCSLAALRPTVVRSTDIGWRDSTTVGVNGASGTGYKELSIPLPVGLFALPFIPFWMIEGKITLQLKLASRESGVIASHADATWKVNNVRYVAQCIDVLDEASKAEIASQMKARAVDADGFELSGAVSYEHFNAPVNSYQINYKIMPNGISSMKALFCFFRDNTDLTDITSRSVSKTIGSRVNYNGTTYQVFNQFYLKNNGEFIPPHKITTLEDCLNHTIQAIGQSVSDGTNQTHITAKNYFYDPAGSGATKGIVTGYTTDTAILVANTAGKEDAYVAPASYLAIAQAATNVFAFTTARSTPATNYYIPVYVADSSYSGYRFYKEHDHPHVLSTFGIGIDLESFQDDSEYAIWSGTVPRNFEIFADLSTNSGTAWTDGTDTHTLQADIFIMHDVTYIVTPDKLLLRKA